MIYCKYVALWKTKAASLSDLTLLFFSGNLKKSKEMSEKPKDHNESPIDHYGWSPGILIKNICGDNYSAENYKFYSDLLESYGFECMRSKPDNESKYLEHWYVNLWDSRGELREIIVPEDSKMELKRALQFLEQKIKFSEICVVSNKKQKH